MALTGELSDLSLSELIEFFCNQRKTGRLKVIYPHIPGYFYIQAGALIDARIGSLTGIDAVYYALTLPNASFKFDTDFEVEQRTINQPWTQVVLEGLRRMDEGIEPEPPIQKEELPDEHDLEQAFESVITRAEQEEQEASSSRAPVAMTVDALAAPGRSRKMLLAVAAIVILTGVTAAVVLTYGYARADVTASIPPVAVRDIAESSSDTPNGDAAAPASSEPSGAETSDQAGGESGATTGVDAAAQMRLEREREARERERRKAESERADAWPAKTSPDAAPSPTTTTSAVNPLKKADAPKAGPKMVTVQVTYDEAGRVTQASGSDPTALRIARQKRFPSGKAGSTTVTIPIN